MTSNNVAGSVCYTAAWAALVLATWALGRTASRGRGGRTGLLLFDLSRGP